MLELPGKTVVPLWGDKALGLVSQELPGLFFPPGSETELTENVGSTGKTVE